MLAQHLPSSSYYFIFEGRNKFLVRVFRKTSTPFSVKKTLASPTSTSTSSFSSLTSSVRTVSWFAAYSTLSHSTSSITFSTTLYRVGELGIDIFLGLKKRGWERLGLRRLKNLVCIFKFSLSVLLNREVTLNAM